ncbi:hypothetical protein C8R47DRAFT_1220416 [Mycena vitilis]|nr:hypothetical protein C8R47DRAFT_1220416 [Mycena vitilis]
MAMDTLLHKPQGSAATGRKRNGNGLDWIHKCSASPEERRSSTYSALDAARSRAPAPPRPGPPRLLHSAAGWDARTHRLRYQHSALPRAIQCTTARPRLPLLRSAAHTYCARLDFDVECASSDDGSSTARLSWPTDTRTAEGSYYPLRARIPRARRRPGSHSVSGPRILLALHTIATVRCTINRSCTMRATLEARSARHDRRAREMLAARRETTIHLRTTPPHTQHTALTRTNSFPTHSVSPTHVARALNDTMRIQRKRDN